MTQSLHPATQGFELAADLYQQVRPNYPQQLIKLLSHLQLNQDSHVLDLGSGTGKFLPYLSHFNVQLYAADPIAEMLEQLQHLYPHVQTVQAQSENLPFASQQFDLVSCAQSFHWFANTEALQEIHRVLKPQADLLLIWNQRDTEVDWVRAIADYLVDFEDGTPRFHAGTWQQVFQQQKLFHCVQETVFTHQQQGVVEQVVSKRLLSTSFIAKLSPIQQQQFKQHIEKIVFEHTGKQVQDEIIFPYKTYVYQFKKL